MAQPIVELKTPRCQALQDRSDWVKTWYLAASLGDTETMNDLSRVQHSLHKLNVKGESALMVALRCGDENALKFLLAYGANPRVTHLVPVRVTSRSSNRSAVRLAGGSSTGVYHNAFTYWAEWKRQQPDCLDEIGYYHINQVMVLLEKLYQGRPTDIHVEAMSYLHVAAINSFYHLVWLYLKDKPNVNLVDDVNRTVICRAMYDPSYPTIRLLLRSGADPTIPDDHGYDALDYMGVLDDLDDRLFELVKNSHTQLTRLKDNRAEKSRKTK